MGRPAKPEGQSATPGRSGNRAHMVDGLSQARQPAPGAVSSSLAGIGEHPWAGFLLFAVAHAAVWTILPFVLYPNLPLDLIEALTYGREWQLGYDKLPPLPWWLVEVAYRTFNSDVAYYALGQISVLSAFAAVWAVMLRFGSPAAAAASVLIIDGLHFFNFTAPKFNHDVVQLPFWALAGASFHGALRTGRHGHWAMLGVALGLAFWAKYFVVVLALPLALFLLIDPRARRCLATPGPYLAAAIGLAIMAPHLVWLFQNDWLPLNYAASRARATSALLDHLTHPAGFALAQLFWLLPAFIIALPLYCRSGEGSGNATKADGYDRRIISLLAFGPAIAVIAGSALSGRGLVSMWGYPLWLFLGPWIVMSVSARINGAALTWMTRAWATVTACYILSFVAQYAVRPFFDHHYRAVLFPGDRLAEEISARYRAQTGSPLRYVVSTMWVGGNISHYSADHPRTLIDGNPRRAPWIDPADLAASGGIVVWTEGDPHVVPAALAGAARNAAVQPPFTLPMRRGSSEVTVGWGVIPPI
jgi:4-amino-4-deoxy-L-arabinose transferase-like glycosyltransferase